MYPAAKNVAPLDGTVIVVEFVNGVVKTFDMTPLINKHEDYTALLDRDFFEKVHIDYGGHVLVWNTKVDISSSAIWDKGTTVTS